MYASVKINGLEGVMLKTEKAVSEQIVLTVTALKIIYIVQATAANKGLIILPPYVIFELKFC